MSVAISLCLWHEHMHTPCIGTLHIQSTPSLIQNHPAWEPPLLGVPVWLGGAVLSSPLSLGLHLQPGDFAGGWDGGWHWRCPAGGAAVSGGARWSACSRWAEPWELAALVGQITGAAGYCGWRCGGGAFGWCEARSDVIRCFVLEKLFS